MGSGRTHLAARGDLEALARGLPRLSDGTHAHPALALNRQRRRLRLRHGPRALTRRLRERGDLAHGLPGTRGPTLRPPCAPGAPRAARGAPPRTWKWWKPLL